MIIFIDRFWDGWKSRAALLGFAVLILMGIIACSPPDRKNRALNANTQKSSEEETSPLKPGFLKPRTIGDPVTGRPWITDLAIVDLDQDGMLDVLACEGRENTVLWIRQESPGQYVETRIGEPIAGPAHVEAVDFDSDGDLDILVASMGVIFPSNDRIGAVVIIEQTAPIQWKNHVVLDKVARVTDVQAGDLDGDGDLDLAVAQFGYDQGEGRWMRNLGNWTFESQILTSLSGGIHSPIGDLNNDRQNDIVMLISQEWEEVHFYENSKAGFRLRKIYGSTNEDYGSSGISLFDVDGDGDLDILYTNGDAFDLARPGPRPWHGVQWFENLDGGVFKFRRLGNFPGAYSPIATDIDGDLDKDIV
ncbi:MAG TPA: VCBS repeat-containing protein, partial [Oceanipulchritudo sp.]|nr:VCBS repeat-containing protein [Oceanipulchritudo sp.]